MHVHILGLVSLNGGDAAILVAQQEVLRRQWPGARITVSDTQPTAAAEYLPETPFVPFLAPALRAAASSGGSSRWPGRLRAGLLRAQHARVKLAATLYGRGATAAARALTPRAVESALREMAAADVLAYTGGTTLTDNYGLGDKIFDLDVVRRLNKPLVFLPQSAGPFRKPENREGLRPVLQAADLILLRDERSRAHVIEVGADPSRCHVVPDIVFALARPEALAAERPVAPFAPRLAVSVREWAYFEGKTKEQGMADYTAALRAAVSAVVRERNAEVTFLSTCQGRPEYVRDDSAYAVEVVAGLEDDVRRSVTVDRDVHHPQELIDVLAGFDAMISTRLHGAISAVCTGVPTLTIAYEFKTTEVWRQLDLADWVLDIDALTSSALAERAVALLDQAPQLRKALAGSVPVMAAATQTTGARVAAVLTGRTR